MMIITTIYVPIYSVLITAALMLHLDGRVRCNLQTGVEAPCPASLGSNETVMNWNWNWN